MLWSRTDLPDPDGHKLFDLIGRSANIEYVDCFAFNFFVDNGLTADAPITLHGLEMYVLQDQKFRP